MTCCRSTCLHSTCNHHWREPSSHNPDLFGKQVNAHLGQHRDAPTGSRGVVYQLGMGIQSYIGRAAYNRPSRARGGGLNHRCREHVMESWHHRNGTVNAKRRRSRYFLVASVIEVLFPTSLALVDVLLPLTPAYEAAYIGLGLPSANNLENFWCFCFHGKLEENKLTDAGQLEHVLPLV